jgi:NAD(P)-dependent dehydrogenase (short-subunit alcohol dehydrogenase family)
VKVGRRVFVTGGSAGIGLAIARALAARGDQVFICGRDAARLAATGLSGAVCDVRDAAQVARVTAAAAERLGGIDTLVNSAGVAWITPFAETSPEKFADILAVNLAGTFNACHAALPYLTEAARHGPADIVNLGSRSGRYAFKGGVGYNTTKFGLQGFTEALFLDLAPSGIRVGLVAPGTVSTGLGGTAPEPWHLAPEDVAHAILAMLDADRRASLNWIELRPARPGGA